jgi:predicted RNA-binding protein
MTNYWLVLFTPDTWREAAQVQYRISGFRASRQLLARRVKPGDVFLCYVTKVKKWAAALEVEAETYTDYSAIWRSDPFPVRFRVRPLVLLDLQRGIPTSQVADDLDMVRTGKWEGLRRGSLVPIPEADANVILKALKQTAREKSLQVATDEHHVSAVREEGPELTSGRGEGAHTRIQWLLLDLGSRMGLDVWVARNDRGKSCEGNQFALIPRMLHTLELPLPVEALSIVEMIDVLWVDRKSIVAAFEIEYSTSIYSGILRMADLLATVPNLSVKLYLVAPDERRSKVFQELCRPTFAALRPPLASACKYIAFSTLEQRIEALGDAVVDILPSFIDRLAEAPPGAG